MGGRASRLAEWAPDKPVLVHRVIARLNVGGPAMHVVNATRGLDALSAERGGGDTPGLPGAGLHDRDVCAPARGARPRPLPGFRTRLIAGSVPPTEGDMRWYADERGVEVTLLPDMSREIHAFGDARSFVALWRLFRRERPLVVHTHTAKAGALGRLAAVLAGVPVRVHTFHGHVLGGGYFPPWKTWLFLEIERQLARFTTRLVVLTWRQAREMSGTLRVAPSEKFAVIPLGLELERFGAVDRGPEARRAARAALGIPEGAIAVGIVGRLVPIKNHELFLGALAADEMRTARGTGPHLIGVVVGGGEREAELRQVAVQLGVEDRILWRGWRRDLPDVYAALDVLALTSHDEGTPVAVLEALAAGVPVVVRDVGGVREVLEDAGAGTLLPPEADAAAWAAALRGTAVGPPLDAETRRGVVERFSVSRLAGDLAALYAQELGKA